MSHGQDPFDEDCAAYVLGALPESAAASMRAHIETCIGCRREVERLLAVADALGRAVPTVNAPPELRARVLAVVEAEAEATGVERTGAARARGARRSFGYIRLRPFTALAAGAVLALGAVLGALVIAPGSPSTRVLSASVAPAARWGITRAPQASLRETGNSSQLVVSGLPAAPAGKIYEVWVQRGTHLDPTDALFNATAAGRATVAVPGRLGGVSAVLVTAERLGGARVPTMAALIIAHLD